MRSGDIHLCDFGSPLGHEPGFRRPALVVSPTLLNQFGTPIVLPITRTPRGYATHVELDAVLPATGHVQCELIRALAASRVSRRLATAPPEVMAQVRLTLRRILGL